MSLASIIQLEPFNINSSASFTFANVTTTGNISSAGNVTAAYLIGNGSQLTGLPASYTNTNVSSYLGTFTGLVAAGNVTATGNVTAQYLIGNGSQLTGLPATYTNTNASSYLATFTGNIAANNITASGNVTAAYLIGNGSQLTGTIPTANYAAYAGNVINATQSNITSIGTLTSLAVTNDVTIGGNLTVSGTQTTVNSTTVNINDINIVLANNATTAAQANGAGITINGAAANIVYLSTPNAFSFSHKIIADGSLLTSLNGSNVTGTVGNASHATVADSANSVAVANVVGIGNIATVNTDGNASNILYGNGTFGAAPITYANSNVAAYLPTYTGNISAGNIITTGTGGNISGANYITANYFSGAGNLLSNIQGANVTGAVSSATTAATVTTNAQPNITSIGTLTSLNVSGNVTSANILTDHLLYANGTAWNFGSTYSNSNVQSYLPTYTGNLSPGNLTVGTSANLGSNANVTITGGTTGQVLTTNGSGALSWSTPSASGGSIPTIAVDTFTGDGTTTTFTLSISPSSVNNIFISYNGAFVNRSSYSVSGTTLTFGSAPANGSKIEVSTLSSIVTSLSNLGAGPASFATTTYTGDGTTVNYTIGTNQTDSSIIATLDGVVQTPTIDYTVSGTTLTFTSAPYNGATIQLRELGVAIASSGSGGGASRAQAMTMGIIFGG